jgi:hypothetical protein
MFFFISFFPKRKELLCFEEGCQNCSCSPLFLYEIQNWLILLFVPIPLSKKYVIACKKCGYEQVISKEAAMQILAQKKPLQLEQTRTPERKRCPYCFCMCDASFTYCPHCGNPL